VADERARGSRRGGLPSWAIRRPIGTVMITSVVLVLGTFFLSACRWTCSRASSIRRSAPA
jgi:hypothetical protein